MGVASLPFEELPFPKTHEELALLVLDGSGSMAEREPRTGLTKADSVMFHLIREPASENPRSGSLLARLQRSRNRSSFWLGILAFSSRVEQILPPTPLSQVDPQSVDFDLLSRFGDNTAIGRALEEADRVAQLWLAGADPKLPRFVTILLMSDGCETCGTDPVGVAQRIHARVVATPSPGPARLNRPVLVIATAAYGDDADEATLQAIASRYPGGQPMFARVQTGAELRDFFLRSISTAV
jgi:von Willebrand factor type A domain.